MSDRVGHPSLTKASESAVRSPVCRQAGPGDEDRALRIVQVCTYDRAGGAEKVAKGLHDAFRRLGHASRLVVGTKRSDDPDVIALPNEECRPFGARRWKRLADSVPFVGRIRGFGRLRMSLPWLGQLHRLARIMRGEEDFDHPGTWRIPELAGWRPDVVHCHNLHGNYFDLRALPWLCRSAPLFITLHDAWLFTGHCAHPFDCERWKTGCGQCPRLDTPPPIPRDATAYNWRRKAAILARSSFRLSAPSQWLMDKARSSMLAAGTVEARVIHNGVDQSLFRPGDRETARAELGLGRGARVLLFAAHGIRRSPWKDFGLLREAFARMASRGPASKLILVALGEDAPGEGLGEHEIRFVPFDTRPARVASFYRAADLYVHASRADTFPNTIVEALSCGTPVAATAVGGIPEQVRGLARNWRPEGLRALNRHAAAEATGVLVPAGDAEGMAEAASWLLDEGNESVLRQLSANAARDAGARFRAERQVREYLDWYRAAVESRGG